MEGLVSSSSGIGRILGGRRGRRDAALLLAALCLGAAAIASASFGCSSGTKHHTCAVTDATFTITTADGASYDNAASSCGFYEKDGLYYVVATLNMSGTAPDDTNPYIAFQELVNAADSPYTTIASTIPDHVAAGATGTKTFWTAIQPDVGDTGTAMISVGRLVPKQHNTYYDVTAGAQVAITADQGWPSSIGDSSKVSTAFAKTPVKLHPGATGSFPATGTLDGTISFQLTIVEASSADGGSCADTGGSCTTDEQCCSGLCGAVNDGKCD